MKGADGVDVPNMIADVGHATAAISGAVAAGEGALSVLDIKSDK